MSVAKGRAAKQSVWGRGQSVQRGEGTGERDSARWFCYFLFAVCVALLPDALVEGCEANSYQSALPPPFCDVSPLLG